MYQHVRKLLTTLSYQQRLLVLPGSLDRHGYDNSASVCPAPPRPSPAPAPFASVGPRAGHTAAVASQVACTRLVRLRPTFGPLFASVPACSASEGEAAASIGCQLAILPECRAISAA